MSTVGILVEQDLSTECCALVEGGDVAHDIGATNIADGKEGSTQAPIERVDQVIASMNHAVSNSLNSVTAASQFASLLIKQGRLDDARTELELIENECNRAARLLRGGEKLTSMRVPDIHEGGVDVVAMLVACATVCTDLGEVRIAGERRAPLFVRGQKNALERLVLEILDNAFQFGAHSVVVTLSDDREAGVAQLEFQDDGPGVCIQPDRLFQSFATSKPDEHDGLGLAIATRIAAAYDGEIVLGESSTGALFVVRLRMESA